MRIGQIDDHVLDALLVLLPQAFQDRRCSSPHVDTSLTTLAHHLDLLRGAGVLVANRSGRKRYRLNHEALKMLHELLNGYLMAAGSSDRARTK